MDISATKLTADVPEPSPAPRRNRTATTQKQAPRPTADAISIDPPEAVRRALAELAQRNAANTKAGVRLHIDRDTHRVVARVFNADNEIIRQIPPEEQLRISARFRELIGLIFDRSA